MAENPAPARWMGRDLRDAPTLMEQAAKAAGNQPLTPPWWATTNSDPSLGRIADTLAGQNGGLGSGFGAIFDRTNDRNNKRKASGDLLGYMIKQGKVVPSGPGHAGLPIAKFGDVPMRNLHTGVNTPFHPDQMQVKAWASQYLEDGKTISRGIDNWGEPMGVILFRDNKYNLHHARKQFLMRGVHGMNLHLGSKENLAIKFEARNEIKGLVRAAYRRHVSVHGSSDLDLTTTQRTALVNELQTILDEKLTQSAYQLPNLDILGAVDANFVITEADISSDNPRQISVDDSASSIHKRLVNALGYIVRGRTKIPNVWSTSETIPIQAQVTGSFAHFILTLHTPGIMEKETNFRNEHKWKARFGDVWNSVIEIQNTNKVNLDVAIEYYVDNLRPYLKPFLCATNEDPPSYLTSGRNWTGTSWRVGQIRTETSLASPGTYADTAISIETPEKAKVTSTCSRSEYIVALQSCGHVVMNLWCRGLD